MGLFAGDAAPDDLAGDDLAEGGTRFRATWFRSFGRCYAVEAHPEAGDVDRVTVQNESRSFDDGTALEGQRGSDGRGDDEGEGRELVAHGGRRYLGLSDQRGRMTPLETLRAIRHVGVVAVAVVGLIATPAFPAIQTGNTL